VFNSNLTFYVKYYIRLRAVMAAERDKMLSTDHLCQFRVKVCSDSGGIEGL
jgi:hypothetical protein